MKPINTLVLTGLYSVTVFKHIALNGSQIALSSNLIQSILKGDCAEFFPELYGKKGVLFSHTTLTKFIDEEYLHDSFHLTSHIHRSIRTLSSGEQKKALLEYLLMNNPDFLMVDNPFDALDIDSVKVLKQRLYVLSNKMPIIQIFKRKSDLLPFIKSGMRIKNDNIIYSDTITNYLKKYSESKSFKLNGFIPSPLHKYEFVTNQLVDFRNVTVSYENRKILNNINWTIKRGEFWHLKGANGTGKTTILTMIYGDNPKAYGQNIYLFGKRKGSGENVWDIKKLVGYFSPSMMDLFKGKHSAEQMIVSGLTDSIGLYQKATNIQLNLAGEWLKLLGIYDKKQKPFFSLSQIHKRMILIARAMIKHPPLLILDEPSIGLDDFNTSILSVLINKMSEESSTAILYVSHRNKPQLKTKLTYQLTHTKNGSIGKIIGK